MATTDMKGSIAHQTSFALRLASHISSPSNADGNAALSPLSLHVVLSFLAAGAGGDTREQLAAILGAAGAGEAEILHALAEHVVQLVLADASGAGGPRVAFANGVFVDASLRLKPVFKEIALGRYKAETYSVDFQTKAAMVAGQVNSWVGKVTSGLIKEILPAGSVDSDTKLVLANALYFKGGWTERFDASQTKDEKFYLLGRSSVKAPFMSSANSQYISSCDNFKVLKLPYQPGGDKRQFSMYILLPEARDGIWSLVTNLTSEPEFLENHIPKGKVPVGHFKLPKFKISFEFEASKLLKGWGLQLPFSAEADLSEMADSPLCVSSIFHKSFVEVNEEGTEAAAASAAVVMCKSLPVEDLLLPVDFVADHPFIFLIREDKVTAGLIKDILPQGSIDNATKLVLGNALYFKGAWHEKFDTFKTKDDIFYLLDGSSVQKPFMPTSKKQYISSTENLKVLKLPYHQGGDKRKFTMFILLPEAHDGLWSLVKRLSTEPEFIENHIASYKVEVGKFKLPKFKISFGFEASNLLQGSGLHLPFSPGADLSEMVDSQVAQNLYISSVHHKSFVEVNEEGTEAAPATATPITLQSQPVIVDFVADHPFLFLIREETNGVVLFVGHVVNPLMSS
ncbi:hypothetical protein ACQ4PT_028992 [Festuca glaucescens]